MRNHRAYFHLPEAKFWSKVAIRGPDECWLWTGSQNSHGYGQFSNEKRGYPAHRVSWEFTNGAIPVGEGYHGTCVLHRCDVPLCVNPAHLWLGSAHENNTDRNQKGRDANRKGEAHNLAKLTDKDVLEIRTRYATGLVSQQQLATEFGVTQPNIGLIVRGERWSHSDNLVPRKRQRAKEAVPRKRDRFGHFAPW